jgi:hypothetical protein
MHRGDRRTGHGAIVRGARVKWLIFGVTLPLLPIAARIAAAWLDGAATLGFVDLFGEGELLVLATVIAAAGIGDLVFDLRGSRRRDSRERLRLAAVHAFALIVVVGSVLFFGLVTYANQTRADALDDLQAEQLADRLEAEAAAHDVRRLLARADALERERRDVDRRRRVVEAQFARELAGHGTGAPGLGVLASRLRADARHLRAASESLRGRATELRSRATVRRNAVELRLRTSNADVDRGREQAATVSVIMFVLSLAAAYPAVSLTAREAAESRGGT